LNNTFRQWVTIARSEFCITLATVSPSTHSAKPKVTKPARSSRLARSFSASLRRAKAIALIVLMAQGMAQIASAQFTTGASVTPTTYSNVGDVL
jgi:hypothetical protein